MSTESKITLAQGRLKDKRNNEEMKNPNAINLCSRHSIFFFFFFDTFSGKFRGSIFCSVNSDDGNKKANQVEGNNHMNGRDDLFPKGGNSS